jgi:hypothetical protein
MSRPAGGFEDHGREWCGQSSRSVTRSRTPRRGPRVKRGGFSVEYWKVSPAKAAFCPKPPGRTQITVNEKFCRGENERGPAFWGLGGLRAEPRRPCIRAGPPHQPYPAEPVPLLEAKSARSEGPTARRAAAGRRPSFDRSGCAAVAVAVCPSALQNRFCAPGGLAGGPLPVILASPARI